MIQLPVSTQLEQMVGRDGEPIQKEQFRMFARYMAASRDLDVIVSLCKEPLENVVKLARLLHTRHLYVYSKCGQTLPEDLAQMANIDFQILPNVGREGHTFVTHILRMRKGEAYPAGWNLFLQAEVEAGLGDIIQGGVDLEVANKVAETPYNFLDLSQYRIQNPSVFRKEGGGLCDFVKRFGRNKGHRDCKGMYIALRGEFFATAALLMGAAGEAKWTFEKLASELDASGSDGQLGHYLERSWASVLGANPLSVPKKEPKFSYVPIEQ
jgi:hypothetical protein